MAASALLPEDDLEVADLKIILLGDSAVGKSKMVERFLLQEYCPRQMSTYALTLFRYTANMDDRSYTVDFWDTAGQEQFENLHPSYYYQAHCCILAFDITRRLTYKHLEAWYTELRSHTPDIPVICVANKIDVDEEVTKRRFKFASDRNLPFFFVSAACGTNVVRVFSEAIRLSIAYKENPPDTMMEEIYRLLKDDDNADAQPAPSDEDTVSTDIRCPV